MALPIGASDLIPPLLLVKALLAWLAFFIFLYYRRNWNGAKRLLPIHYFFTKWRAVKHAYFLGYAALGFALGFSIELLGTPFGMSADAARFASGVFEAASLFCMLYVFFSLALEDVPHFQRISDSAERAVAQPAGQKPKKAKAGKKRKGK